MPGYDDATVLVNAVDVCGSLAERALVLVESSDETLGWIPVNRLSNMEDRQRLIRAGHFLRASGDTIRSLWAAVSELGGRLRAAADRDLSKEEGLLEPGVGPDVETLGGRRRTSPPGAVARAEPPCTCGGTGGGISSHGRGCPVFHYLYPELDHPPKGYPPLGDSTAASLHDLETFLLGQRAALAKQRFEEACRFVVGTGDLKGPLEPTAKQTRVDVVGELAGGGQVVGDGDRGDGVRVEVAAPTEVAS